MITPTEKSRFRWLYGFTILLLVALLVQPSPAYAQDPEPFVEREKVTASQGAVGAGAQGDVTGNAAPGTNLLKDGSFETNFTPGGTQWYQFSENLGTPVCDPGCGTGAPPGFPAVAGPHSGANWVWFGGLFLTDPGRINPEYAFVYQPVAFPSKSCKATLQFYLWIGAVQPGADANDDFIVWIDDIQIFTANATQQAAYSTWKLISLDVSAFNGGTHEVWFDSMISTQYVNFNLDDIALYASNCTGPAVKGDYDGDRKKDIAVFRPSNSTWYLSGIGPAVYGQAGDIPVPADYTGDGVTDIAVFRPSNNTWYIRGVGSFVYGQSGDIPVVGDYNGDGRADIAVFRESNSTWYIRGIGPAVYGQTGDIPVVADYNGDRVSDIAVFRESNSTWYIRGVGPAVYGQTGDIPVVADYNGDGRADIAVFRPSNSTWYIRGIGPAVYGQAGDIPVVGDYNGDGLADIAVFRPSNSTWYLRGIGPSIYGQAGDEPV